jgi:hypothetical protein
MSRFARRHEGKSEAWMRTYRNLYGDLQKKVNRQVAIKLFGKWVCKRKVLKFNGN